MAKAAKPRGITGDLSVSRNVLKSGSDFDTFDLNFLVRLLVQLREFFYITAIPPIFEKVFIRFADISGRHGTRREIVERINKLSQREIRYRLNTLGIPEGQVITGLFSSIVEKAGGVYVRIADEAIPWLLYIGQGVGYTQIEPEVFLGLHSLYHKRLYLFLCARVYKNSATFKCKVEELRSVLGLPGTMSISIICKRYLQELGNLLEQTGSKFAFTFDKILEHEPRAGHPALTGFGFMFVVRTEFLKKSSQNDSSVICLDILQQLHPVLKEKRHEIIRLPEIFNLMIEKNVCDAFVQAMTPYKNQTKEHQANTMKNILKDRYGIDIITRPKISSAE